MILCFIYINMLYNLSAKYCQENKERLQRKLLIYIKIFLKKKKRKKPLQVSNVTKISQKMKNKIFLEKKSFFKKIL